MRKSGRSGEDTALTAEGTTPATATATAKEAEPPGEYDWARLQSIRGGVTKNGKCWAENEWNRLGAIVDMKRRSKPHEN